MGIRDATQASGPFVVADLETMVASEMVDALDSFALFDRP